MKLGDALSSRAPISVRYGVWLLRSVEKDFLLSFFCKRPRAALEVQVKRLI